MTIFSFSLMLGHKYHFTSVYCQQKCDNVKHSVCLKFIFGEEFLVSLHPSQVYNKMDITKISVPY